MVATIIVVTFCCTILLQAPQLHSYSSAERTFPLSGCHGPIRSNIKSISCLKGPNSNTNGFNSNLLGNQLFERITLLFMEQTAYPPNHYIRFLFIFRMSLIFMAKPLYQVGPDISDEAKIQN